jgi:tRNA (guanosine-2'-O-)-methyltransferase
MAVPATPHYHQALDRDLPRRPHVHWVRRSKLHWIADQRETSRIVAVELAEDATPLTRLVAPRTRTVLYRLAGLM